MWLNLRIEGDAVGGGREGGHVSRAATSGKSSSPRTNEKMKKNKEWKHQPDAVFKERQSSEANARMAASSEEDIDWRAKNKGGGGEEGGMQKKK